jgi:hypothetical protein
LNGATVEKLLELYDKAPKPQFSMAFNFFVNLEESKSVEALETPKPIEIFEFKSINEVNDEPFDPNE